MALQNGEGSRSQGSRVGQVRAAHHVVGQYLARRLAEDPSVTTFRLAADRGLTYDDAGVARPVTLFHIVSFAENMSKARQATETNFDGKSIEIRLSSQGRDNLIRLHEKSLPQPAVPRKQESVHPRDLMRQRLMVEATALHASVGSENEGQIARVMGLMKPIMECLSHGPRSSADVTWLVGIGKRMKSADLAKPWLNNGATFEQCVGHVVRHLTSKGMLADGASHVGITEKGRDWLAATPDESALASGLAMPAKARSTAQADLPVRKSMVMSEEALAAFMRGLEDKPMLELLKIWGNAIRLRADPDRKDEHLQAAVVIRAIEEQWNTKAPTGEIGDAFRWPRADVRASGGHGEGFETPVAEGMLGLLGYRVGLNGESREFRQRLLTEVFRRNLPNVFPESYMGQWGEAGSPRRLQKMADCIASFARNASRRSGDYDEAIRDWEQDLAFLKDRFYRGHFNFGWPRGSDEMEREFRRG